MSRSKKTVNVNPIPEAKPKVEVIDFYNDLFTTMQYPVTKQTLDRIGNNWVLDAKTNPNTWHPSEYTTECGMSWDTVIQFAKKYDHFMDYYKKVKQILGVKRERKMIEASPNTIAHVLPQYLEEYVAESERRSSLKAKEQGESKANITVVIPERKKKDDTP